MGLEFFKGNLIAYGGCNMNIKCFSNLGEMNINDPCPENCSGNGHCKNKQGCVCNPNFILNDCSQKAICEDNCNSNGSCGSNLKCNCFPGWGSETCSSLIACPKNCTSIEAGVCQEDKTCKCNKNFSGKDCSVNENDKNTDPLEALMKQNDKTIANQAKEMKENLGIKVEAKDIQCKNNCSGHGRCDKMLKTCDCDVLFFFIFKLYFIFYKLFEFI